MDTLRDLATRFDEAATALTAAGRRLTHLEPPASSFGAGAPGRLGEVGRALHRQWLDGFGARGREAAAASARLADVAGALRATAADYSDVDDTARGRVGEV
ncbi:hypothetical protein RB614_39170 [Phytohabitans sp. ZYX-F-186]|uniref:Excreted virulence factor EspC (Type VII ESX diderm) n=1 Tax=Phytohabitans maris TaxID=3071409 RepID=A0ABU0ZWF1_9ACTN|nr:hypothetical protein [Phytohabitans sp. ZYX-F-186]MDQ7910535.1 hypothetical protein [Phytohabitans sp. ZYX-F-186]